MSDTSLARLYKLHRIDFSLYKIRMQAAALDSGKEESEKLKAYMKEVDPIRSAAKKATNKVKELGDKVTTLNEKKEQFDKQLFDGTITNAREIENIQKELGMLSELIKATETELAEKKKALPESVNKAKETEKVISEIQKSIVSKRRNAVAESERLKASFEEFKQKRPGAASDVPAALLNQYEIIRKRRGDTAMAVVNEQDCCGACGLHVPEQSLVMVRGDRPTSCQGCRRILFIPVPTP
jgi:predicted  nucleic acid-binding Zn-ribbon protein